LQVIRLPPGLGPALLLTRRHDSRWPRGTKGGEWCGKGAKAAGGTSVGGAAASAASSGLLGRVPQLPRGNSSCTKHSGEHGGKQWGLDGLFHKLRSF